jgi:hypothetical protein
MFWGTVNRTRLILFAIAILIPTAQAGWEKTRKTVIDPINTSLHRHLPKAIAEHNLELVLQSYDTETGSGLLWSNAIDTTADATEQTFRWTGPPGREEIATRYRHLFELFPQIEQADLRIGFIHWEEAGTPADVRLIIRGTLHDGQRGQLEQHMRLELAERHGEWLIVSEEIVGRRLVSLPAAGFVDATAASGIDNLHANESSPKFRLIGDVSASSGSAVGDIDGDGCEDLFLVGNPNAVLYGSRCDGTFEDVTAETGLPQPFPTAATGAVFFDADNDGWPDLYVTAARGGDRFFRNTGHGRFEDVTEAAGIRTTPWGSMPIVADYDRDGDLDVYVIRMGDHERSAPVPNYNAQNGIPNSLLRNEGNGTFTDVSQDAGLADTGWGLAGAWGDLDDDGWPDLYIGNEFGFNALYQNNRDGTFSEIAQQAGAEDRGAAMGVAWGDVDNDGDLDLYVSNMYANSRWALFHPEFPAPIPWYYQILGWFTSEVKRQSDRIIDDLTRGSTLLRNEGENRFTDITDQAGVRDGQWGWASEFFDYDNDGNLDIYAVNGFITGEFLDDTNRFTQPERTRTQRALPKRW